MAGIIIALIALRLSALSSSPYDLGVYDNYFFHIRTQFHLSLDALLAGVMCAMMWHNQKIRNKIQKLRTANILFLSGLIILVSVTSHHLIYVPRVSFYEMAWLPAILALGFSLTMLGLLGGCCGYRFFENKFFSKMALISYSLYLTHCFFLGSQSHVVQMIAQATGIQNLSILWLLSLPVYLLFSAGTAILLHRLVERPFILWSKSTPHTLS